VLPGESPSGSNRLLVLTAILGSVASVALAWALSVGSERVLLPVVLVNDDLLGLVFLALPVLATVAVGLRLDRSRRALWAAGVLTGLLTTALAAVVWIAWVLIACGENLERCVR
jgi:hypothetical protein